MNDFFTQLVRRARLEGPSIQPRRPSRFESPAAGMPAEPAPGLRPAAGRAVAARDPGTSRIFPPTGKSGPSLPLVDAEAGVSPRPEPRSKATPPPPGESRGHARGPQAPAAPVPVEARSAKPEPSSVESFPQPMETAPARVAAPVPVMPEPEPVPAREHVPDEPVARPETGHLPPARSPAPAAVARPVRREPAVPRARPSPGEAFGRAAPDSLEERSEAVGPRIEVTIGTIEVRAMVPSPAPPAAPVRPPVREPAPPVSLDDYLKRPRPTRP